MIEHSKLQIGCMVILVYIAFIYFREHYAYKVKKREVLFELLIYTGVFNITFDGITAYTVNQLEQVPAWFNMIAHACFLSSIDALIFLIFLYILDITKGLPRGKKARTLIAVPFFANIAVLLLSMPGIEYIHGDITNYSMGIPVYTCYIMAAIYMISSAIVLAIGRKHMNHNKLITIATCIVAISVVTIYQMIHPQALLTSLVTAIAILGVYLNMENPLFQKLRAHNQEMVMGFATLVEKRDGSTGGHIRRTTTYVEMLARELKARGLYKEVLTEDYIRYLVTAASMHDVGKIAIPDAILQKAGKLTDEEFTVMRSHAAKGGEIIQETFGAMGDEEYERITYQVARYHHEKWNGKGYPEGLSGKKIPLCARIVSVADVFDAVSAKRCYRDGMPLEDCFEIISNGIGQDFEPCIAETFLSIKEEIAKVVRENAS